MKILLINPSQETVYGVKMMPAYQPLGLLYVGTVLQKSGHTVRLLDIDTERINEEKFRGIFREFNPDAVGLSSVTPVFKDALKWAGIAKGLKNVPVVMGGIHATIAPKEVISFDVFDVVVAGEGENTAEQLFSALESGKDLRNIRGIVFKAGGKIMETPKAELIADIDTLPFPDRKLLKNASAFMPPDAFKLPVATIMTSRGCPGDCTFCCTKQIFTKKFRARSVQNIIAEVKKLMSEGIKEIHIADDTFTVIKKRALEFCGEIKRQNIKVHFQFMNGLRADFVDKEVLSALRSIGLKTVGFGVESGNQEVLKNIKKNIPLDITRKAFRLSKELGFETWAFLVFGLPGDNDRTIQETIAFTKEVDPDFAKFFILKPYPGTDVYEELKRKGLVVSHNYEDYGLYTKPVHTLPELSPEKMMYWQKRAFREFYLRPSKIVGHIARIKSLHQVRLAWNDLMFALYCMFNPSR